MSKHSMAHTDAHFSITDVSIVSNNSCCHLFISTTSSMHLNITVLEGDQNTVIHSCNTYIMDGKKESPTAQATTVCLPSEARTR